MSEQQKCPKCGAPMITMAIVGDSQSSGGERVEMFPHQIDGPDCSRRQLAQAREENTRLLEEMVEHLDCIMRSEGILETQGKREGWWDTGALSHVKDAGDRLVELGKWERHPNGYGRRWWYRPLATSALAAAGQEEDIR